MKAVRGVLAVAVLMLALLARAQADDQPPNPSPPPDSSQPPPDSSQPPADSNQQSTPGSSDSSQPTPPPASGYPPANSDSSATPNSQPALTTPFQLAPGAFPTAPAPAPAQPAAGPACILKLSPDRSTLRLLDASGVSEKRYVSLGQDRVQHVYNSADGAWSVAIYKIRGEAQFGFIAVDLANCQDQEPVGLPGPATAARVEAGEVTFQFENGKSHKFSLKNSRVD